MSDRAPDRHETHKENLSMTFGMLSRVERKVRGYSGSVASFDQQRSLVLGALVNAQLAAQRLGRDLDLTELTQSAAAGWFWRRYGRECYRTFQRHEARDVLTLRHPGLPSLLFMLANEP